MHGEWCSQPQTYRGAITLLGSLGGILPSCRQNVAPWSPWFGPWELLVQPQVLPGHPHPACNVPGASELGEGGSCDPTGCCSRVTEGPAAPAPQL